MKKLKVDMADLGGFRGCFVGEALLFEVLDTLEEKGLISQSRRAKSVILTEEGVCKGWALQAKYLGTRVEDKDQWGKS